MLQTRHQKIVGDGRLLHLSSETNIASPQKNTMSRFKNLREYAPPYHRKVIIASNDDTRGSCNHDTLFFSTTQTIRHPSFTMECAQWLSSTKVWRIEGAANRGVSAQPVSIQCFPNKAHFSKSNLIAKKESDHLAHSLNTTVVETSPSPKLKFLVHT
jgi:hypothetical protein